jgi:hypothetical protein
MQQHARPSASSQGDVMSSTRKRAIAVLSVLALVAGLSVAAPAGASPTRAGDAPNAKEPQGPTAKTKAKAKRKAVARRTKARRARARLANADPNYHYFFTHVKAGGGWPSLPCGGYAQGSRSCSGGFVDAKVGVAPFGSGAATVYWEDRPGGGFKFKVETGDTKSSISGWIPDRASNAYTVTAGSVSLWNVNGPITSGTDPSKAGKMGGTLAIDVTPPKQSDWTYDFFIAGYLIYDVNLVPTVTVVSSSPSPSVVGQNIKLTAVVQPDRKIVVSPTGTIQFSVDGKPKGDPIKLTNGLFVDSPLINDLAAGTHYITAKYSGDGAYATSASRSVGIEVDKKS